MVKVEAPFSLDSQVAVHEMITARSETDEAGDEECVALNEVPAWVAVDDDPGQYQDQPQHHQY